MHIQIDFTGFSQRLFIDGKDAIARIFTGIGEPSKEFNTILITLDASESSLLDWKLQVESARKYAQEGFFILWELQFSLSYGLLNDDVQLLPLHISVQHFVETILPEFQHITFGVALYRGTASSNHKRLLDDLKLLSSSLPDELACFIFLDTSAVTEPEVYFHLVAQHHYGHLKLILKGPYFERYPYAVPALAWEGSFSPLGFCSDRVENSLEKKRISYALCLPEARHETIQLPITCLESVEVFRLIPETLLHKEWDGVDHLIICPELVSEQGWRKIRGFIAAGGEIITATNSLYSFS